MREKIIIFLLPAIVVACGGSGMSRQDILRYHDKVNQLNLEVADIEGKNAELLTPDGFAAVKAQLDEAVDSAMGGDRAEAEAVAEQGLKDIVAVRKNLAQATEEMDEVLENRSRAEMEGATGLFRDDFDSADSELKDAARLLEQGKIDDAREARTELMKLYADLELKSLKEGKQKAAEAAIEDAEEQDADDYAPQTFEKAKAELKLVTSVLESDRTKKEKADEHAMRTIWLANRAIAITQLVKMFEDADYEYEDVVLWHQGQLDTINEPLGTDLPFDESDAAAVRALRIQIAGLLKSMEAQRVLIQKHEVDKNAQRKAYETRIGALLETHSKQLKQMETASKSQLAKMQQDAEAQLGEAQAALKAEAEVKARYEAVSSLFADFEALVSRQEDNVLISVHSFNFASRSADIGAENFGLLDKIVSAINKFPDSKIVVTGHTDSKGSKDRNLRISIDRAESVARFLTTMGKIAADRVQAKGMGETKPIASNDNREGRAKNRRIEILIVNK